jgi:alpha-beta hydrolase superfamily lysophospholipase
LKDLGDFRFLDLAMTPVSFGGCFGWLHAAEDRAAGDVAVLICTPFGYDALPAYSSLRLLADQLANAGYPALRFDYPGTGDACDEEIDRAGGHWMAWRQSVDRAVDWLRTATGARRIVLCGVRGSALLAGLAAAERDDVAGLVLLTPVLRGHSYMRQLHVEARIQTGREMSPGEGLAFREFRFSAATVAQIANVDLRRAKLKAGQKVAICAQAESQLLADCVQAWTAAGAEVRELGWHGLEPLVRPNIIEEDSLAHFTGVLSWLREAVPPAAAPPGRVAAIAPAELRSPGWLETPLRFGPGERLFGMLCWPDRGLSDCVVIIGNGGRDPHYGAARHAAMLARRLARAGVASFRMDFAGLGDSLGPAGEENVLSKMFATDRTADITAALDVLERQGFRRFAMSGLCAGAFHAFLAALADPRLSTLLLINMPFFELPGGSPVDHLYWREMSAANFLHRVPRPQSWRKLFKRRRELGVILRVQVVRLREWFANQVRKLVVRAGLGRHPTFPQAALASLGARGVRTLFLFSRDDLGIVAIQQELGCRAERINSIYPGTGWHIVSDMDHDLSYAAGRDIAESLMIDFVTAKGETRRDAPRSHVNEVIA